MPPPNSLGRFTVLNAAIGLAMACIGCSQRGPERFRVHGTVTYAGAPVPIGRIVFEPDLARGNRGPQGFAPIENGKFDTAAKFCQGVVGGPTIVRIDGFEMLAGGEDATIAGRQLFKAYETRIDLPLTASPLDFEVPATLSR